MWRYFVVALEVVLFISGSYGSGNYGVVVGCGTQ